MKIVNHRLLRDDGTPYPFRATPNQGGTITPRWLVMHYTAGGTAEESIGWLCSSQSSASAHVVIAKDGSITQLVPFDRIAWHAGRSSWRGINGVNSRSLGIELDGFGFLGDAGPGRWKFRSTRVADSDVVVGTHRFGSPTGGWAKFPQAQLNVALELAKLLVQTYGLEEVIGHDDVAPGRKQDPGPAFDMATFRAAVMGAPAPQPATPTQPAVPAAAVARFRVTTTLNIRSGPGTSNPTVAGSPLPSDTIVRGLADQGDWKQVAVEGTVNGRSGITGWVGTRFLASVQSAFYTTLSTLNVRTAPGTGNPLVGGSPLPRGTTVIGVAEQDGWRRIIVEGTVNGVSGITGWASGQFLQQVVPAMNVVGDPVPAGGGG